MKLFCTFLALVGILCVRSIAAEKKPNVLFIAIDDLRDWVGFLGNTQVKTPNLDRLAARGVAFTRAYCASPVCNPSRTALLTGLRAGSTGVYGNDIDWRKMFPADAATLPLQFKNHGYYVAGAGKVFHTGYDRSGDWNDYMTGGGKGDDDDEGAKGKGKLGMRKQDNPSIGGLRYGALDCADKDMADYHAVSYAIKKLNEPHDQPFFLACGLHKPHLPWGVPKKYYDLYPIASIVVPKILTSDLDDVPPAGQEMANLKANRAIMSAGKWQEAVQAYLATISFCDAMIGRLLDGLDQSGHANDTIICCWSDHGWHLGEKTHWAKAALWEEATHAPLIFVAPGLAKSGGLCGRTVDYMSIYPTLCDLAGLPAPKHVQGISIKPLLVDPNAAWDRPAVTTQERGNHAVRSERWRYIRYADGSEELYDHDKDPLEWTNLARDAQFDSVKADLARWLPKENVPAPGQVGAERIKRSKREK